MSRPTKSPPAVLHHEQVRRALGGDPEHPARPGVLATTEAGSASVRLIADSGDAMTVAVTDPERFTETLDRSDLCRLNGDPLVLFNEHRCILAVATGPATAPARVTVNWVSRLEDGSVVELLGDGDQPSWQIFAVTT